MSTAEGRAMRAARDGEDTKQMTFDAIVGRIAARTIARARQNPDLDDRELAAAVRADLRGEMRQRGIQSARARAKRAASENAASDDAA